MFGPWSTNASFIAPESAFLRGNEFADPLTNGRTVGVQHGGRFIPGQGWRADILKDGIDYDLEAPCVECELEFDVTGFGRAEGYSVEKDLKWITDGRRLDLRQLRRLPGSRVEDAPRATRRRRRHRNQGRLAEREGGPWGGPRRS